MHKRYWDNLTAGVRCYDNDLNFWSELIVANVPDRKIILNVLHMFIFLKDFFGQSW
jgi:hypothetical protein